MIALFLLVVLAAADTFRRPEKQVTSRLYIGAVRIYQFVGRPLLEGRIECRFKPTCSEYSIEAVRKHGVWQGLEMTYDRLNTCEIDVPRGTQDPVPAEIGK